MPKLRPLGDQVLVRLHAANTVTAGGIHLPDAAVNRPHRGTVVAVGPGRACDPVFDAERSTRLDYPCFHFPRTPLSVNAGDEVLFNQFAGTQPDPADESLRLMSESELLAVVEPS